MVCFIDVLPYASNWPGQQGAECGVSYFCADGSLFDSHLLVFRFGYWGN